MQTVRSPNRCVACCVALYLACIPFPVNSQYDTEGRLDIESILILITLTGDVQLTSRDMPVGYLTFIVRMARGEARLSDAMALPAVLRISLIGSSA